MPIYVFQTYFLGNNSMVHVMAASHIVKSLTRQTGAIFHRFVT